MKQSGWMVEELGLHMAALWKICFPLGLEEV